MELSPFLIYIIMQADNVVHASIFLCMAFSAINGILLCIHLCNLTDGYNSSEERGNIAKRWLKITFPILLLSIFLTILMPRTNTLVAMYGIPAAIDVAQGLELDETAKKVVQSTNKLLDTYLKEK